MPGMDGIQFLTTAKERTPDSVRMMLTGNADQQTAIDAVNEGSIFRFLTKPCPPEKLAATIEAGIEQYRLIVAERELLEKTLSGSVKVLTEILSLVNPTAFSRASRIRRYVKHIVQHLKLSRLWQFELAAMLSQIGCVTLPYDVLNKIYARRALSDDEEKMFSSHPTVGAELLTHIPRLEPIARMIAEQQRPFEDYPSSEDLSEQEPTTVLGSQILKVALDFDQLIAQGMSCGEAASVLSRRESDYNPKVVAALQDYREKEAGDVVKTVKVRELNTRMIIDEDVKAKNGVLLVGKGHEVTYPVLARLRNFSRGVGVVEPFRVRTMAKNQGDTGMGV
ncbi:MAG: response regulator, partial [Candidatus Hydrogenedentes bacterium]|nr:response regulator [Candidatus Hydrogenedentota bacterium]